MKPNANAAVPVKHEDTRTRLLLILSIGLSLVVALLLIGGGEPRSAIGVGLSVIVFLTPTAILTSWILRTRASLRYALQQIAVLYKQLEAMANSLNLASARLEEAQATHRALTSRFRHDLISPLGSISGFLELFRDGKHGVLDARQLSFVQNMERSVGTLLKLAEHTSVAMAQREPAAKASAELLRELKNPEQLRRV